MKKIYIPLAVFIAACTFAQTPAQSAWRMMLKVVDGDGNPIAGAKVDVGYYTRSQPAAIDGVTDTNGIFVAEHSVEPSGGGYELGFAANKPGYYSVNEGQLLPPTYVPSKWNQTIVLTLQKIIDPIAMYARRAQIEIPALDKPIGFDLEKYDWIGPYGKGDHGDVVFEAHRRWVNRRDFDVSVKITFSNSGDGFLAPSVPPVQGSSGPKMPVNAPLNPYVPELQLGLGNSSTGGWKGESHTENYYFRVRAFSDTTGNVKSALYGKIYCGFTLDPINSKTTLIVFTYYLNPTQNDQNVEFDPNRNLFQGLPFIERVQDP